MKRFVVLAALVFASSAHAAPGLLLGVDDDSLKWYGHTQSLLSIYGTLGLGAVRVTLDYPADAQERTELQRINQASRRTRVILAVTGAAATPPLDDASRAAYCGYIASVLRRLPLVHDVAIWTEPNSTTFWQPGRGAAAAYESLLAACYDAIHAVQPQANVIATSAPHARPGDWYAALGRAYRASGRTLPIFDTIGHNAYPQSSSESPLARHKHSIDEGDVDRLTAVLQKAFGAVPPVWYLEDGFQAVEASPLYSGTETDRRPVSEEQQAVQLTKAVELAYCQPGVTGFFNFELRDDASLAGWQSGLLRPDWSAKPAFTAYLQAIAAVRAGTVDCGQLSP
ncbi:MAG: hypothetical protein ABUS54_10785 [Actinomycetota bacterium]